LLNLLKAQHLISLPSVQEQGAIMQWLVSIGPVLGDDAACL